MKRFILSAVEGIRRRLQLSPTVAATLGGQLCPLLAAPLTIALVAHRLSLGEQGLYYTFSNLVALQVFVEMGLSVVLVQVTSHQQAKCQQEAGNSERSIETGRIGLILRMAAKWYLMAAGIFVSGVGAVGCYFFETTNISGISWVLPWWCLCGSTALNLVLTPFFAILEGLNQIKAVAFTRLAQTIFASGATILALVLGYGLYALAVGSLARAMIGAIMLAVSHRARFVGLLRAQRVEGGISWMKDIWPLQWRIAVSWVSGYFIYSMLGPIVFRACGASEAGRFGMTWVLASFVEVPAQVWIRTHVPQFSRLIARGEVVTADRMFRRLCLLAVALSFAAAVAIGFAIAYAHWRHWNISDRLLDTYTAAVLLLQRVINTSIIALATFVRSFNKEPLMISATVTAGLVACVVPFAAADWGVQGVAWSYLCVTVLWAAPSTVYVYHKNRAADLMG